MKCYCNRFGSKLLNIAPAAPVTVTTLGTPYRILPDQSDGQTDAAQDYKFVTTLNVVGGSGTPAAQLVIQGSVDGVLWFDVAMGASRTVAGVYAEIVDSANGLLMPWVRAKVTVAGTTPPAVDATIDVVSTGPFQLSNS